MFQALDSKYLSDNQWYMPYNELLTAFNWEIIGYSSAGYVFLSGYALPEWHHLLSSFESQIPVFQSHGTEDPVIPFDWAQATSKLLATNPNYNFYEYAMGHNLNMPCIAKLQEFLKNSLD